MTETKTSTAIAKKDQGPGALVKQYQGDIAMVLPSHVKPDQFVRIAQSVLRRDPALARAAQANVGSFMTAVLKCASDGLVPGETFHFVAFGNAITGIRDYKGDIELMFRAGSVASIHCEVVHANDHFKYEKPMTRPEHAPDWFGERGEMVGVYAYADMKDGSTSKVIVLSKSDVMRHKAVSKSSSGASSPWQKWPESMWMKTAIHELEKWVPTSAEYQEDRTRASAALTETSLRVAGQLPEDDFDPDAMPDLPTPNADDEVIDAELLPEDD